MSIPSNFRGQVSDYVRACVATLGVPPEGRGSRSVNSTTGLYFGRRHGKLVVEVQYYREEAFGDDDDSTTGGLIPPRMGYTRILAEASGASVDELLAAVAQ